MLKRTLVLSTAIGLFALSPAADAGHMSKWYAGIEAGANWSADADMEVDTTDPVFGGGWPSSGASFDTGWGGMATVGYAWPQWRVELELGLRKNDFDSFTGPPGFLGTGDMEHFSQMINIIRDFDIGSDCNLSLGAGIGGDSVSVTDSLHVPTLDGDDYVMAWQLMAGISHELKPGLDLVLNYRYFNANGPDITETDALARLHNSTYDSLSEHTLTIGLRFDLSPSP
ncbi:MAG: outer membrane beta-barrel protein [Micropepsaceae bacterium]